MAFKLLVLAMLIHGSIAYGKSLAEACPVLARTFCSQRGLAVSKLSDLGACLKAYGKEHLECAKFTWIKGSRMNIAGTIKGCSKEITPHCPKADVVASNLESAQTETLATSLKLVREISPTIRCLQIHVTKFSPDCADKLRERVLYAIEAGVLD